jgi:hypothetical protein
MEQDMTEPLTAETLSELERADAEATAAREAYVRNPSDDAKRIRLEQANITLDLWLEVNRAKLLAAARRVAELEKAVLYHRVYAALVYYAGAPAGEAENFVLHLSGDSPPTEWRFCGSLGFGGKFYPESMTVRCYPEDEDDRRRSFINNANTALRRIAARSSEAEGGGR